MESQSKDVNAHRTELYAGGGLAVGAALGLLFGLLLVENLAFGCVIGAVAGLVMGAATAQERRSME
jgi:uncharacterized membrane protein